MKKVQNKFQNVYMTLLKNAAFRKVKTLGHFHQNQENHADKMCQNEAETILLPNSIF